MTLFAWTSFAGLVAAFVFVGFPQIDIAVSRLFNPDGAFVFNYPGIMKSLRMFFFVIVWAAAGTAVVGLIFTALFRRKFLTLSFPKWLFLALCLLIGPGLTANTIFKDNWGRARPFHIEEFGGKQKFTPVLMYSDQCEKNCSFFGGEAASSYMVFFALALLFRRWRRTLFLTGIAAGMTAGFIRIGQGGHFLSDVIFAGIFMALIAEFLYWLIFDVGRRYLPKEEIEPE